MANNTRCFTWVYDSNMCVVPSGMITNSLDSEFPENTRTMNVLWNMRLTSSNGAGSTAVTVAGGFQMSRLYGLWGNCRKKGIQFCYYRLSSPFKTLNPTSTTALWIGTWWARGPVSKRFVLLPLEKRKGKIGKLHRTQKGQGRQTYIIIIITILVILK